MENKLSFKTAFKELLRSYENECDNKDELKDVAENAENLQNSEHSNLDTKSKCSDSGNIAFEISSNSENLQKKSLQDCEKKDKLEDFVENVVNLQNSENSNLDTKLKCSDSGNIAFEISSISENLQKQSFQDCDKLISEHIKILRKDSYVRSENQSSETDDEFEFFYSEETELFSSEISKVEPSFLDNVPENVQNITKKHLSDPNACDTSVQISFFHDHDLKNLGSAKDIAQTRALEKQSHKELEHHRKLFVGNFDEDIDTERLYYYFLQFGKIERTINIRDHKAISKYIGYIIVFEKTDSITNVQTSAPHVFQNRTLKLYLPENDGSEPEEFCKLFVRNFDSRTTESDLINYFSRWGIIVNCIIENKSKTKIPKYYGSVTFKFFSAMNDALVFPFHRFHGQKLRVDTCCEERQIFRGFDKHKCAYSTKPAPSQAKISANGSQQMNKRSFPSKNIPKREFLTERKMLQIIEKSKIFKPMVVKYDLKDFDGAGVNIFKKPYH